MRLLPSAAALGICAVAVFSIVLSHQVPAQAIPGIAASGARIELQQVLAGLAQPVFVTGAGDGSQRLFIAEQPGLIKVLRPGAQAATMFLDISSKVLSGGEQGLLGLAFHPEFSQNRRLFVNYTRKPDGATVIAEYQADATNPDVAVPVESFLLVIAQPYANHNGGMVAFGPDGYLYIATGDGGSGNDPENRAQNPQDLLGKILRIDVDRQGLGVPYAIPPSNPFSGSLIGRPEIFALGLRNPWRFSFDRATSRLYAGDVGQSQMEEVDLINSGANYGWRVWEGSRCTGLGPAPCSSPGFTSPITEYDHSQGRCSITGGYVYRGSRNSLPFGAYVFADFCTGEIFMLYSGVPRLLLRTGRNISSFGEDDDGEIYVADWSGSVHRIINPEAPTQPAMYLPRLVTTAGRPAGQDEWLGFAAANVGSVPLSLTLHAYDTNGQLIQGAGISNPGILQLAGGEQTARLDSQIFGQGFRSLDHSGWVRIESDSGLPAAFFLAFDEKLSSLDGADTSPILSSKLVFPEIETGGFTQVWVVNPNAAAIDVSLELLSADGSVRASAGRVLQPNQALADTASSLFPGMALLASDYLQVSASQGVAACEFLGRTGRDGRGLSGQDATSGAPVLYAPQFASGGAYRSVLSVLNLEPRDASVTFQLFGDDGRPVSSPRAISVPGKGKIWISDPSFFGDPGSALTQAYLEIRSSGPLLAGSVTFAGADGHTFATALPLVTSLHRRQVISQVASNASYFTGIAVVNPGADAAITRIEVFSRGGLLIALGDFGIPPGGRISGLLTQYFPSLLGQSIDSGYVRLTADRPVAGYATFGTHNLAVLSAIPAHAQR